MAKIKKIKKIRSRDALGKYNYENMDLVCVCGHILGQHCAPNPTRIMDCFEDCDCENFKKSNKERGATSK